MSHNSILVVEDGNLPPDVPLIFEGNSGPGASAIANVLNIIGAGGASTVASGNTVTITVTSSGFTWDPVTSVSPMNPIQIVIETGYICNGTNMVTFNLPLTASLGDSFIIVSNTSAWQIQQMAGQQIGIGPVYTTGGTYDPISGDGAATSNRVGDMVEFIFMGMTGLGFDLWRCFPPQGTISLS